MSKRKAKPTQHDITLAAFEALLEKHEGRIGPRTLLDAARDQSSPFHDFFEWDDEVGGEQYRLIQAGQLIRRWHGSVVRIDSDTKTVKFETTRRVQSPAGSRHKGSDSYETIEQIMADPQKREDMLRTVLRELSAYRRRYAQLAALADVWQAIDEAVDLHSVETTKQEAKKEEDRPPA